jgi:hypothetical protein
MEHEHGENIDTSKDFLLLGGFLDYLLANGFEFGPDKYILVKQLLNALQPNVPKEKFRHLLCPLFATNAEKQSQFYYLFDRYFESVTVKGKQEPVTPELKEDIVVPRQPRQKKYILVGALVFALFTLLCILLVYLFSPKIVTEDENTEVSPESALPVTDGKPGDAPSGNLSLDTIRTIITREVETAGAGQEVPVPVNLWPVITEDVSDLVYVPTWWERYGIYVKLGFVMLFLVSFVTVQLFRDRQRKFLLFQQQFKKPPDSHPLEIPNPKFTLFHSDSFYDAAKTLRERDVSENFEIDLPKTIQSTVDAGGYLDLQYRPLTKPSEYLVLIDVKDGKDHIGQWMKQLSKDLQRQDVLFEMYYYNTDPRIVWRYSTDDWFYLEDLFFQSRDYRLIIFGDGEILVEGFSGRLKGWTELIGGWEDRVLCTPVPVNDWSRREVALETLLSVLPATTYGLTQLNTTLDRKDLQPAPDKRLLQARSAGWSIELPDFNIDIEDETERTRLIASLKKCLGENLFEWLCACAVYPELHWDFTLELGRRLGTQTDDLLLPKHLYFLSLIPWFQHGAIPGQIRERLGSMLPAHRKILVLQAIMDILNLNPPSENTYAYSQYKMHLVLAELQLTEDARRKKQLQKEVRKLAFADPEAKELATLKYASALDDRESKIPAVIKNTVYENGLRVLGVNAQFRNLLASFAVIFGLFFIYITRQNLPVAVFNDQMYLLHTSLDSSRYFTFRALEAADSAAQFDMYKRALGAHPDFAKAYYNRAWSYNKYGDFSRASNDLTIARLIADTASASNPQFTTGPDKRYAVKDSLSRRSLYNLGATQYGTAQYAAAIAAFSQMTAQYDTGWYERGLSYLYHKEESLDSALTDLNNTWSKNPDFYKMQADTLYHPVVRPLVIRYRKITDKTLKNKIRDFLQNLQVPLDDLLRDERRILANPPVTGRITVTDTVDLVRVQDKPEVKKYERQDRPLVNGRAAIKNQKGLWGFIDSKGVLVIDFQYDEATDFSGGDAQVRQGDAVFFIDKNGKCIEGCPDK